MVFSYNKGNYCWDKEINMTLESVAISVMSSVVAPMFIGRLNRLSYEQQRLHDLLPLLRALVTEMQYNSEHRGDPQNPFQMEWMKLVLEKPEFYMHCQSISQEVLEVYELAQEANIGQVQRRHKHIRHATSSNSHLQPADVRTKMKTGAVKLLQDIPGLERAIHLYYFKGLLQSWTFWGLIIVLLALTRAILYT